MQSMNYCAEEGEGGGGGGECHLNHFVFPPQLAMLQARLETAQSAAVKW